MAANFKTILFALEQGERRRARRYHRALYTIVSGLALLLLGLLVVLRDQRATWYWPYTIEWTEAFIRVCSGGRDNVDPEDDSCQEERRDGR